MNLYYVRGYLWLYIFVNMDFYCNFCIYNAVPVNLLPGVEFVLYIKDHNGNKFDFKLCVILDKLSLFTTFCQIKRKTIAIWLSSHILSQHTKFKY